MRIIINQEEIEEAIEKLVLEQVKVPDDMFIHIDLKATRGDEGYQAFIDLSPNATPQVSTDRTGDAAIQPVAGAETLSIAEKVMAAKNAPAEQPRRRGRPLGSKNKPKTNDALVEAANNAQALNDPVAQATMPELTQDENEPALTSEIDKDTSTSESAPEPVSQTVSQMPDEPQGDEVAEVGANEPESQPEEAPQPEPEMTEEEQLAAEAQATEPAEPVEPTAEPEEEAPAPAPEVTKADVTTQASEQLASNVSEPEEEAAPKPAPTRSLFANLGKPQN